MKENTTRSAFPTKFDVSSFKNMPLSLLERSRLEDPEASDEHHMRRIADHLVEELDLRPPVDFELVASYQDVARVEVVDIPWAGCLLIVDEVVVIRVRNTDSHRRRRFTVPHEIGHTFFAGYREEPHYRCSPALAADRRTRDVEWLCDTAASSLLFPARYFRPEASTAAFGFDSVDELASRYDASVEATAHTYVEAQVLDTLFVVLEPRTKPRESPLSQPKLRVMSAHPKGRWPFIPRYKSAPADSQLTRAFEGWPIDESGDLAGITPDGVVRDLRVSARKLSYTDSDGTVIERVFALYQRPRSSA